MTDFNRIRQNVELMASKGAPASDIDGYLSTEGFSPDQFKTQMSQFPTNPGRLESMGKYSAGSGVANLIDSIPRAVVAAGNLVRMGVGTLGHATGVLSADQMPATMDPNMLDVANPAMRRAGLIDDNYAPRDPLGSVLDSTTQTLTGGGINPGAMIRNAGQGMIRPILRDLAAPTVSGAAAGAAGVATSGVNTGIPSLDRAIQIGSQAAASILPGSVIASRGTAGDRVAAAMSGVTPEQIAMARILHQSAAESGSPITGYEAIQGVTGPNPKMQTQQRIAEQSDSAAGGLTTMMQNRPTANAALFGKVADGIAPVPVAPDATAGALQNAAARVIQGARDNGNALAAPYYATTSNNPNARIPSGDWNSLTSDPAIAWALQQTKNNPLLGVQGAAEGSLQWLDTAKKFLDSHSQALAQSGDRFPATQAAAASRRITSAVDPLFPDYAMARSIYEGNQNNVVTPMEQGQIGKLASSDNFRAQANNLLPEAPMDVTPSVVNNTLTQIGAADPNIGSQFLAQYLRGTFNEANQDGMTGGNPMGGAKFAAKVAGNPMQAGNLTSAVTSVGADPQSLATALQIFGAQGMKPATNSATAFNANEASLLSGPMKWLSAKGENWTNGLASKDLAAALMDQDSVDSLNQLGQLNGTYSPFKQNLMANLLLSQQPQQ